MSKVHCTYRSGLGWGICALDAGHLGEHALAKQCTSSREGMICDLPGGHTEPHVHRVGSIANHWSRETDAVATAVRAGYKSGKVMMELVDLDFVMDMGLQLTEGLSGERVPNGWHDLPPAEWRDKCAGAALRHMAAARRQPGARDPQTGATHWAGVAVNAMMCWWFERKSSDRVVAACIAADCTTPRSGPAYCVVHGGEQP